MRGLGLQNQRGSILVTVVITSVVIFLFFSTLTIFSVQFYRNHSRIQESTEQLEIMNSIGVMVRQAFDLAQLGLPCPGGTTLFPLDGTNFCFPDSNPVAGGHGNCVQDRSSGGTPGAPAANNFVENFYCINYVPGTWPSALRISVDNEHKVVTVVPKVKKQNQWAAGYRDFWEKAFPYVDRVWRDVADWTNHLGTPAYAQGFGIDTFLPADPGGAPARTVAVNCGTNPVHCLDCADANVFCARVRVCPTWIADTDGDDEPNCTNNQQYITQRFAVY